MWVIEAENLWKRYGEKDEPVLRGVSLSVARGEFLAIAGSSGSGKSTLLSILGCIDIPTQGLYRIDGIDVRGLRDVDLTRIRAERIGFVFQRFNLVPTLTAVENVEYPLLLLKISRRERRERAMDALSAVGLKEFARRRPLDLSGGQQQRVAIARAVVKRPSIVLADEPTASLDHQSAIHVLDLMRDLNAKYECTFLFSSHDPTVLRFATRRLHLIQGQFQEVRDVA